MMEVLNNQKDYLGTASPESGGGGTVINNEDITVTSNGTYTAGEGYTGIGTATVNVPEADIVTATNTTSSAITLGDKVWLEKVAGGYNALDLKQNELFDLVGSVTVNSSTGVASNFSNTSYLKLLPAYKNNVDLSKPWTFRTHVKLGSPDTRHNSFIHTGNGSSQQLSARAPFFLYFNSDSPNPLVFGPNNGPWISGSADYVVGAQRWIECGWTGTEYFLRYSTDGVNYVNVAEPQASTNVCTNTSDWVSLGFYQAAQYAYFRGDIYLFDTSMENNGTTVWKPYMTTIANAQNTLTGFAQEAIATSDTGEVKTALPEE